MVELCRIDDRLLHGQVAVTWVGAVAPEAILIANDEAATNEMSKLALKMAKPAGVKLAIKTVDDAIALLNNPNAKKNKNLFDYKNDSGYLKACEIDRLYPSCKHRRC